VKLCKANDDSGLGFRDMEIFNEALLAKQIWRLIKDNSSIIARLLRAKCYLDGDILRLFLEPD